MLRFPHISQCSELAKTIGQCVCVCVCVCDRLQNMQTCLCGVSDNICYLVCILLLVLDYTSMCVKQPIGRELFRLFCETRPDLQHCNALFDAMVSSP